MNNLYMIPANTKSGKLIFNIFKPIDLVIFLMGLAISILFFLVFQEGVFGMTFLKLLPLGVCTLLVIPVAHYHNVMGFIKELYLFFAKRRVYYWKGWCVRDEYKEG